MNIDDLVVYHLGYNTKRWNGEEDRDKVPDRMEMLPSRESTIHFFLRDLIGPHL